MEKRVRICVTQPAWNQTKLVLFERIFITDHISVKEVIQNSSFNPKLNKTLKIFWTNSVYLQLVSLVPNERTVLARAQGSPLVSPDWTFFVRYWRFVAFSRKFREIFVNLFDNLVVCITFGERVKMMYGYSIKMQCLLSLYPLFYHS